MSYTQLAEEERYAIYFMNKRGETKKTIADELGRHKSTIYRELKRNKGQRGYRHKQAHRKALSRRKNKREKRITEEDWAQIEALIRQEWSPEQISGRVKTEGNGQISPTWIYEYIWLDADNGGDLYTYLRIQKKKRKKYGKPDRRGKIPNRTSIEERPPEVDEEKRIEDWEGDTVIGKGHKGGLVTLVSRGSLYTLIGHIKRKTAEMVADVQTSLLTPFKEQVRTMTYDNGLEFSHHERVANALEMDTYFAHAYASWERGANENTNGLIRQYLPKDRELTEVDDDETQHVMDRLNHRPRKTLNYRTPHEVFFGTSTQLTVALGS